eukprot:1140394-Prymnesium_polylepis.1
MAKSQMARAMRASRPFHFCTDCILTPLCVDRCLATSGYFGCTLRVHSLTATAGARGVRDRIMCVRRSARRR